MVSEPRRPTVTLDALQLHGAMKLLDAVRPLIHGLAERTIHVRAADNKTLALTSTNGQLWVSVLLSAAVDGLFDAGIPQEALAAMAATSGQLSLGADSAEGPSGIVRWTPREADAVAPWHWPTLASARRAILPAGPLAAALPALRSAVLRDNSRPILRGALVEPADRWSLTCTDGYRLARVRLGGDGEAPAHVVPAEFLAALATALGRRANDAVVYWQVSTEYVVARTYGVVSGRGGAHPPLRVTLAARLLTGRYPDYRGVLPTEYSVAAQVDRDRLAAAITTVKHLLHQERQQTVRVEWREDGLSLDTDTPDAISATHTVIAVPGVVVGDERPAQSNYDLLLLDRMIRAVPRGPLTWSWLGRELPSRVSAGELEYVMLPMREIV